MFFYLAVHILKIALERGRATGTLFFYSVQSSFEPKVNTLGGQTLVATMKGGNVQLIDAAGNRSTIVATDVAASNGVIRRNNA